MRDSCATWTARVGKLGGGKGTPPYLVVVIYVRGIWQRPILQYATTDDKHNRVLSPISLLLYPTTLPRAEGGSEQKSTKITQIKIHAAHTRLPEDADVCMG